MKREEVARSPMLSGEQLWTSGEWITYEMESGSPEALDAVTKVLNTWNALEICAFVSEFGFPCGMFSERIGNKQCYSVDDLRKAISTLRRLDAMVRLGRFHDVNYLNKTRHLGRHQPAFEFVLDTVDGGRGFASKLVTRSLHAFLVHEITSLTRPGHVLWACAQCSELQFTKKRSNAKYCSDECKTASSRLR
ncbi:hypothetical protein GGE16_001497 [Rhizobium leguminosarum]|uniref:Uncharacterized protein n=1 Tax=Rhizobium leguminosarum TaxID=384 RepID=A0AAE2SVE5_RHILE|nr:hypothetical protein [Rhizobium leguminosarum]MBB4433448.1 hypothetical protein [Rhizobium esperanzae]MBB4294424.1 hypothetical protein [Rhizobium leguminosarum]MBB4305819.1 hypothetical protein [Rhizobium leguminosarum]MBB4418603.1 hypothetical protein [Rhizobium leguminosarum]